jgi:hypothetical protein
VTGLSDVVDQVEVTVDRDDQQPQERASSGGRRWWTEHAALAQLGDVLEPARPVERGGLDVGLGGADPAGGLGPGWERGGGLGLRAVAQRPACGAHER